MKIDNNREKHLCIKRGLEIILFFKIWLILLDVIRLYFGISNLPSYVWILASCKLTKLTTKRSMLLIYRAKIKFLIFFYVCECMIIKHYYYLVYTIYSQRRVTKLFFLNTQNLNKTEAFKTVFFFCCKTTKYKMIENEMKWTKSVDFSFYIFTVVNSNQNTT